jgi:hypothetical protein
MGAEAQAKRSHRLHGKPCRGALVWSDGRECRAAIGCQLGLVSAQARHPAAAARLDVRAELLKVRAAFRTQHVRFFTR